MQCPCPGPSRATPYARPFGPDWPARSDHCAMPSTWIARRVCRSQPGSNTPPADTMRHPGMHAPATARQDRARQRHNRTHSGLEPPAVLGARAPPHRFPRDARIRNRSVSTPLLWWLRWGTASLARGQRSTAHPRAGSASFPASRATTGSGRASRTHGRHAPHTWGSYASAVAPDHGARPGDPDSCFGSAPGSIGSEASAMASSWRAGREVDARGDTTRSATVLGRSVGSRPDVRRPVYVLCFDPFH